LLNYYNYYYYFQLTWHAAQKWCRSRGLQFGDVDTRLKKIEINAIFQFEDEYENSKTQFWVASSNLGFQSTSLTNSNGKKDNSTTSKNDLSCLFVKR
jgi:hypothetical protein